MRSAERGSSYPPMPASGGMASLNCAFWSMRERTLSALSLGTAMRKVTTTSTSTWSIIIFFSRKVPVSSLTCSDGRNCCPMPAVASV